MRAMDVAPDLVLCSPAVRAVQTWEGVASGLPPGTPVEFDEAVYHGGAGDLLGRLRRLSAEIDSVLVLGHNPGLEDLALGLGAGGDPTSERGWRRSTRLGRWPPSRWQPPGTTSGGALPPWSPTSCPAIWRESHGLPRPVVSELFLQMTPSSLRRQGPGAQIALGLRSAATSMDAPVAPGSSSRGSDRKGGRSHATDPETAAVCADDLHVGQQWLSSARSESPWVVGGRWGAPAAGGDGPASWGDTASGGAVGPLGRV